MFPHSLCHPVFIISRQHLIDLTVYETQISGFNEFV